MFKKKAEKGVFLVL